MSKRLKFIKNAAITEIWDIYSKLQLEPSININPEARQDWSYTFGLTDQKCFIEGVDIPQPGGLNATYVARIDKDTQPDEKDNLNFFNYVYNQCHLYIADNQTRYIGRADLKDVTHGKVFAMTLLAHLCQAGMDKIPEVQEKYKKRIIDFTYKLLNNEKIKKTTSNDVGTISCQSALNNIYSYNASMVNAQKEEHDLDNFFDALNKTVVTAQTTLIQVNELLSQFTPTKSAQYLFKNDDNNTNRTLSHQESAAKNDPLTKEMFGRVEEIYHTKNGYKQLYDGIKYKLPDSNSFLLSHFNEEQKQNLKDVLQWRDKLFVLSNELRTVYNTAKDNRVATRSEFLPLIDSYLKEINRVKMELQVCVERFDLDCHTVYRSRENQVIIDGERKNWENQYLDKNSIEGFRAQTIALKRDIASAFSQISFNHFVSLKKIGAENDDIAIRGKELFGDFSMPNSNFQKTINQAQTNELLRQADIILLRLQQLSDDCDDLLKKASSMENKDESAIRLLQYRKEALSQMLQTMQNHPVDEGTDIMENEFVIIENDNPNTEIINAYSSGNLLELIDGKSVDVERNQLKAKLEFYRTMPDDLSENSKSFLGSIEEKLNAQGAEKVKTIITNFERIVNQGMDYKEAYIKDAGHYDKTVFFSHNNNGKKNASKVMGQWKKDSEEVLKQVLKSFKGDKVDWKKESTINEFKEALESALQESMKNLIVNESYSSYKEHSFRNYLHQFYKNVFPENNPDVLANKLEKREVKFNEVPGFNEQTLRNFEKTLQPEPQAQMRM